MRAALVFVPLLAACAPFSPTEGLWEITAVTVVSNTCVKSDGTSIIDPAEPGDLFTLTVTGEDTFRTELPLDQGETIVSECTLVERDYTCLPVSTSMELVPDGTMTITQVDGGTFTSPSEHDGGTGIDITCAGDGCPDLEDLFDVAFPCHADLDGDAVPVTE